MRFFYIAANILRIWINWDLYQS